MSERQRRSVTAGRLDAAAFDAALERAAERVLAVATDDTAGARVVARVLAAPPIAPGPLLWVPAAALTLLVLAAVLPLREAASPRHRPSGAGAAVVSGAMTVLPADATSDAASPGASAPPADTSMVLAAAATSAAVPSGRRRARPRATEPRVAADDPSTLPLLEVTGALYFAAGDDASGNALAPPPLPVDALALESLEAEALDPRRD